MANKVYKCVEEMDEEDERGLTDDENEELIENRTEYSTPNKNATSSGTINVEFQFRTLAIIGVIVCFFAYSMYFVFGRDQTSCSCSFDDIKHQLQTLRKKFPSQDLSLWAGIITGLNNLRKEPVEPAVYLLAFDEDSIKSSTCIAEVITTLATKLLQPCESETRRWLLLNGTSLSRSTSKDPGDLIDAITKENEHSKIVVVSDVEKIPAKLAKGFHSLVDTYGAMAKRQGAVYIFTLKIPRWHDSSTVTKVVEDILLQKWKELDRDELQPLVTRISHFILPVTKEDGAQMCPLRIDSTVDVNIP